MNPAKALELVERYACLTKRIKAQGQKIGENLEKCKGISGVRGVLQSDGYSYIKEPEHDDKGRDKDLHLIVWYTPEWTGDGYYTEARAVYEKIGEEHAAECPHCYSAHLAIQERRQARKELGAVKGAMSRSAT